MTDKNLPDQAVIIAAPRILIESIDNSHDDADATNNKPLSVDEVDFTIDVSNQDGAESIPLTVISDGPRSPSASSTCAVPPYENKNGKIFDLKSIRAARRTQSTSGSSVTSMSSRKVKKYYQKQDELKEGFEHDLRDIRTFEQHGAEGSAERDRHAQRLDHILASTTFLVNVFLIVVKTIAACFSGSYSVISSVVDSAVDVTSGIVIWVTTRAIKKRDHYQYPRGRTRLEPIAIIIVSIIMAVASVQMIVESLQAIFEDRVEPNVGWVPLSIMIATITLKFTLMVVCYKFKTPSTAVLAQDHRNDCISNTVAILCAFLGYKFWRYLDPMGAIAVSCYIAVSWFVTGRSQINLLSGKAAKPAFINRIIKICLEHHPAILFIDTVLAYHWGTKFLVEVHVVMDKNLTLQEAHDISEPLQTKIESLSYVERAFLHVDHEYDHRPEDEHKIV